MRHVFPCFLWKLNIYYHIYCGLSSRRLYAAPATEIPCQEIYGQAIDEQFGYIVGIFVGSMIVQGRDQSLQVVGKFSENDRIFIVIVQAGDFDGVFHLVYADCKCVVV